MKVPNYIKSNLNKQADLAEQLRELGGVFSDFLTFNNVDTDSGKFINVSGYILGDCSSDEMLEYLQYDLDDEGKEK